MPVKSLYCEHHGDLNDLNLILFFLNPVMLFIVFLQMTEKRKRSKKHFHVREIIIGKGTVKKVFTIRVFIVFEIEI